MNSNIKNIVLLLFLSLVILSCEDDTDGRFNSNPNIGWIEFNSESTTVTETAQSVTIPINVEVPIYEEGLTITYTITAAEGDFTSFVSSTGGTTFADPSDYSRSINVEIPLMNTDSGRDFITSFDVKLTAIDKSGIRLGVNPESILTHRVIIPCSNPEEIPSDFFTGQYTLDNVDSTIGPANNIQNFNPGVVSIAVSNSDPNVREFRTSIFPEITPAPIIASIRFVPGDNVVTLAADITSSVSCDQVSAIVFAVESIANSNPWTICDDSSIIVTYTEDSLESCAGSPNVSSFSLTKI